MFFLSPDSLTRCLATDAGTAATAGARAPSIAGFAVRRPSDAAPRNFDVSRRGLLVDDDGAFPDAEGDADPESGLACDSAISATPAARLASRCENTTSWWPVGSPRR